MKKRNFLLVLLLIVFALVLVACGEEEKKEDPTYNITFEVNGGSTAEAITVKKASEATLPTPSKEGYKFMGWYLEGELANEFNAEIELTADVTLYAKWEKLTYSVKFMVNDNVVQEEVVEYGAAATAPSNPVVEGYDFVKWDIAYNNVKTDLVVKAELKIKEYTVKFMDGNVELGKVKVEHGQDATAPTNLDKEGYTFKEWDSSFVNVTSDLVINAVYEANQYNITYYDGETPINLAPATITYGVSASLPEFVKTNTIFEGWYSDSAFTKKVISFNKITCDTSLYAKYYTVKFYDDTTELTTLESIKVEDGVLKVPSYEVSGFTFVGWYTDDNYLYPFDPEAEVDNDLNLKALLVNIDYNGGSASWVNNEWGTVEFKSGIDAISTLPEEFEKDFFTYLSDEDLLNSEAVGATMKALTWEAFSAVNPNHSGDPKRIWNDSTANKANDSSDGYTALYLFGSLEYDETTGKLTDIVGGFLGTEPYKTKYFNVMQHLVLMYNGKYRPKNYSVPQFGDSNAARGLYGFLLDGWFYGTQGMQNDNSVFDAARKIIPTTSTGYTWNGTKLVAYDTPYEITSENYSIEVVFAVPFGTTKFVGWYLDAAGNTQLTDNNITNRMTIYAKYE